MKSLLIILLLFTSCSYQAPYAPPVLGTGTMDEVIAYMATTVFIDCTEAANTALIACNEAGYDAFTADFYQHGVDIGHRICIAYQVKGEWYIFSNNNHAIFYSANWERPATEYVETFVGLEVDRVHKTGVYHNQGGV